MLLAVDPGETVSGLAVLEEDGGIVSLAVQSNVELLAVLRHIHPPAEPRQLVLEEVSSYGMRVGRSIFHTIYYSGRLWEAATAAGLDVFLVPRIVVRRNLAGKLNSGDKDVRQAVLRRRPELAGHPGFVSHAVQALGLGLVFLDYSRIGDAERFRSAA